MHARQHTQRHTPWDQIEALAVRSLRILQHLASCISLKERVSNDLTNYIHTCINLLQGIICIHALTYDKALYTYMH
jgi:hypothetical protein